MDLGKLVMAMVMDERIGGCWGLDEVMAMVTAMIMAMAMAMATVMVMVMVIMMAMVMRR